MKGLELVILDDDGHAEETGRGQHIHQGGLQSDWAAEVLAQLAAADQHFVPQLDALILAQIEMSGGAKIALQKLTARRDVQPFERFRKQLEIRILDGQT